MGADVALDPHDRALIERVAGRIAELRLETPALLTLETARPVSLLASQTLAFFEPFVQALFVLPDYRRFASLLERREAIEQLASRVEQLAAERQAREASRRAERRAPRRGA
ncbi:MAG TPA: hypothetical protein VMH61_06970 [Candidatus Acidoferrales bacterium]|nr:hypothetical protein [Candidatus Acidoferrales bacterium]